MPFGSDGRGRSANVSGRQSHVDENTSLGHVTMQNVRSNSSIFSDTLSEKSQNEQENDPELRPGRPAPIPKRKSERIDKGTPAKRARTLLTLEQSRVLHELLQETCFPSTKVREEVAAKLGLSPRKVQVFFQNKRQKQRKKSKLDASTSQSQKIAPRPVSTEEKEKQSPVDESTPSIQSNPTSSPEPPLKLSSSSVGEYSKTEDLYSQCPYEYYGYDNGWQTRLIEQHRPRYTYQPHAVNYWHSAPGIHRAMYHFAPRINHGVGYTRNTIDPGRETLPPIMSDVRSGASRLPSINDMISGAHA